MDRGCDLRAAPDFSTRPRPSRADAPDRLLLVAGIVALAASANAGLAARRWASEAESVARETRSELNEARQRLTALETRPGAADVVAAQIILTTDAPPARVLTELEAAMGPDVRFSTVSLHYREQLSVDLRVEARAPAAYDALLARLTSSERFVDLAPGPEEREGELSAQLSARYAPRRILP
jgi:hypothetical protein